MAAQRRREHLGALDSEVNAAILGGEPVPAGALGHAAAATTMRLDSAPGDAVQVDFGSGPIVPHPRTGEALKTWIGTPLAKGTR